MKTKKDFCLILMVVALVLCQSCGQGGGTDRYDSRLETADSLLRENKPDSALLLLSAIDGASLRGGSDRAYHALLLTQAQYRCYEDITNDSTINVALDYYQHHTSEQEKLTRAYIYKGAVTEVLGDPEAAMNLYKQACDVAAPNDHYNLGYAKMRIASLYRDYLAADSLYISLYKKALYHFEQVPDSFYIANCLSYLGNCYSAKGESDSAIVYLERAASLTKALHLTAIEMTNQIFLADLKMFSKDTQEVEDAKNIALSVLGNEFCPEDRRDELLLISAYTLAKLNKPDSASIFLSQVDERQLTDGLLVLYHDCLAEIAGCHGDIERFRHHFRLADDIADSLLSNNMQQQLRNVEAKYDNEVLTNESLSYKNKWLFSLLAAALLAGALVAAIMAMRRRLARRQRQVEECEMTIEQLRSDAKTLATRLNEHQAMSDDLKQAIQDQIELYTQLVEKHVTQFAMSPGSFSKAFAQSYSTKQPDSGFWKAMRSYANARYNNIIDKSLAVYPALNETDVNYLALYCCKLPTSVIMACMGYKEAHSAYNKKRRVAEALGSPVSLDEYIRLFDSSF